jgi:hypothetical protein
MVEGNKFISEKNRAGDSAFAGPRSPAPLARGGSPSGSACVTLACAEKILRREGQCTLLACLCQHYFVTLSSVIYLEISPESLLRDTSGFLKGDMEASR